MPRTRDKASRDSWSCQNTSFSSSPTQWWHCVGNPDHYSVPPFCKPSYNNDSSQEQRAERLVTVSPITTCTSWINPNCSFLVEFVCVLPSNTQRLGGRKRNISEVCNWGNETTQADSKIHLWNAMQFTNGKVVNKLNIVNVLVYT